MSEHLWLVGMMGSGKSVVGPALAARLDMSFFDTDEWIWLYQHMGYTGDYEFIYFE